jgi:hypothetical protein
MPAPKLAPDPKQRLKIIIDSTTPLVGIETLEESRALTLVREAASELQLPIFEWSIADGLVRWGENANPAAGASHSKMAEINSALAKANLPPLIATGREQYNAPTAESQTAVYNTREAKQVLAHLESASMEAVYVLKDMHRHLDDPVVVRLIREVAQEFSSDRRTLVLTAPTLKVPDELANIMEYLELPLPDRPRLRQIIDQEFRRLSATHKLQLKLDEPDLQAVAANLCGLTEEEAERAIAQAIIERYGLTPETVTDVLEAKQEILRRTGMLEFVSVTEDMSAIGGLENLKLWLHRRRAAFGEQARAAGLEPPRGVIIMGVQGCGKSMSVRCIAGEWKLPLVKFDTSAIFDKYIGETEKRIQKLFRVAEQLAPCVLWIDELEKVFAGSGPDSASSDAGTSSRLLGAFLTWMQDRRAPVFVAATSNNVTVLPPELIRKGRFDELFFVDLPNGVEREAILKIQLKRRKQDPAAFDLHHLVVASEGFSGAEIDAATQAAMYACFGDQKPLCTEAILQELSSTTPLSVTRAEDIGQLRAWARDRAVAASLPDGTAVKD